MIAVRPHGRFLSTNIRDIRRKGLCTTRGRMECTKLCKCTINTNCDVLGVCENMIVQVQAYMPPTATTFLASTTQPLKLQAIVQASLRQTHHKSQLLIHPFEHKRHAIMKNRKPWIDRRVSKEKTELKEADDKKRVDHELWERNRVSKAPILAEPPYNLESSCEKRVP